MSALAEWRLNRDPGWTQDIGYVLQDEFSKHHFNLYDHGSKPDDPGWHRCICGDYEGYWSWFGPHVADYLRAALQVETGDKE